MTYFAGNVSQIVDHKWATFGEGLVMNNCISSLSRFPYLCTYDKATEHF